MGLWSHGEGIERFGHGLLPLSAIRVWRLITSSAVGRTCTEATASMRLTIRAVRNGGLEAPRPRHWC